MNISDISIAIPSCNTVEYLKMAYSSLRRYYPTNEILIYDDGSDDGSWEWITATSALDKNLVVWRNESGKILGHTVTYNRMAQRCKGALYTIFHSDMIAYAGYLENLIKHWKEKAVVSATRIEPAGIYPPGKEKILQNFGLYPTEFKRAEFEAFCAVEVEKNAGKTTRGIFAPWLIKTSEYLEIGGQDETLYAPFPHEDADFFLRLALANFTLIQSWDSLVFHWISRGHKAWAKNGIGYESDEFKFYESRARKNYLRRWNRFMRYDEYRHPLVHPVYDVAFEVTRLLSIEFLSFIEPYAQKIYVNMDDWAIVEKYIELEQPTTRVNLRDRICELPSEGEEYHDIIVSFSEKDFATNRENIGIIQNMGEMIANAEIKAGDKMKCGIFNLRANGSVKDISCNFIDVKTATA